MQTQARQVFSYRWDDEAGVFVSYDHQRAIYSRGHTLEKARVAIKKAGKKHDRDTIERIERIMVDRQKKRDGRRLAQETRHRELASRKKALAERSAARKAHK